MALEDVKDNVRDQIKAIWGRIRETDAYLQLSEKYQSLSPTGQKLSMAGVIFVGFLLVMAVPYSFYSGSQSSIEEYEGKRDTVRQLFKVNREAAGLPPAPPPVTSNDLQTMARQQLTNARLAPDQIVGVNESPANVPGIAKTIDQAGVQVSLAKVNLKQIVDIGSDLQNMQNTARMMGLEIKASAADPHYYDVIYKIVAFSAKPEALPAGKKGKKK
jgi:hypothetical protein